MNRRTCEQVVYPQTQRFRSKAHVQVALFTGTDPDIQDAGVSFTAIAGNVSNRVVLVSYDSCSSPRNRGLFAESHHEPVHNPVFLFFGVLAYRSRALLSG
jgi:hypothetical protein